MVLKETFITCSRSCTYKSDLVGKNVDTEPSAKRWNQEICGTRPKQSTELPGHWLRCHSFPRTNRSHPSPYPGHQRAWTSCPVWSALTMLPKMNWRCQKMSDFVHLWVHLGFASGFGFLMLLASQTIDPLSHSILEFNGVATSKLVPQVMYKLRISCEQIALA